MNTSEMTMEQAADILWKRKFSFSGRSSRCEYWLGMAALYLYYLIAFVLLTIASTVVDKFTTDLGIDMLSEGIGYVQLIVFIVLVLAFIGAFILALGMTVRRLHDVGKCGWWVLIGLIPFIGDILLFVWLIRPSDGNNEYGFREW